MKHFLITRFNLKNKYWNNNEDNYKVLSKTWLDNRLELFLKYCFPSVVNQVNKNFIWLIAFDTDTPNLYKDKIALIFRDYDHFQPIYIDGFDNLQSSIKTEIYNRVTNNDRFILTTRLDNDDIIHQNFIKTIQDLFIPYPKTVIDLKCGYQLILNNNLIEVYTFRNTLNPFISLIESISDIETVISKNHREWKKNISKSINKKDFLWIQLIHDKNHNNKRDLSLRKTTKLNPQDFGITLHPLQYSLTSAIIYNIGLFPYHSFISIKRWLKNLSY